MIQEAQNWEDKHAQHNNRNIMINAVQPASQQVTSKDN